MSCRQEVTYEQFLTDLGKRHPRQRFPIHGTLELTFRCVLRCKHCYTACNQYAKEEMAAEEWCRLLDEASDLGTIELLITGGDPMLNGPLFRRVYSHAKQKGMWVTVFTSGNLIDEKWAQFFSDDPPFSIEITLYGATEPVYENVTQIKGSYRRCREGIEWLHRYQVPFKLKMVVMEENKHELHACKKIAESYGQEGWRHDPNLHPKLDGVDIPLDHRVTPREVVQMDLQAETKRRAFMEKQFRGPLKKRLPEEIRNFHCNAGNSNFLCNPYGKLQVCTIVPGQYYDWRNGGSLEDCFYNYFPTVIQSKPKSPQRCDNCNLWRVCDRCAGWSSMVHGDLETPVDFICEVTHRRAMAFGTDPRLYDQSLMYKRIMEGKTFPETIVPDEGFHGTSPSFISLPAFRPTENKVGSCGCGG